MAKTTEQVKIITGKDNDKGKSNIENIFLSIWFVLPCYIELYLEVAS